MAEKKSNYKILHTLEERFMIVSLLQGDLSRFPLEKGIAHFATDKDKARMFAEVFTPLHLVDEMLNSVPDLSKEERFLDMCAGYGQFSIRMLRKFYEEQGENFDLPHYLKYRHFFSEIQVASCYRLLWIFTTHINIAIGDSRQMGKLPEGWRGIWQYIPEIDSWVNVTRFVKALCRRVLSRRGGYDKERERIFVQAYESFVRRLETTAKEYKMSIQKIISTKTGRKRLLEVINKAADSVEANWQDKPTPEWIVREMIEAVPDVSQLKKILVLFNVEFLETLVRNKKIDPAKIDFGYDSEIEGLYAKAVYGVETFSIGKNLDQLKEATEGKTARYDVIFSNPPYQIEDGGYSKSSRPVYHEIAMHAIDHLHPHYVCMITPSRWMAGGKGLNEYRARMLSDKHIRKIEDFPGTYDVFDKIGGIAGGVSYFLWDRDYDGLCEFNGVPRDIGEFDIMVRNNTSAQILRKVLKKSSKFCNEKVLPQKPFGLRTYFKDFVDEGTPGAVKCYAKKRIGFEKYVSGNSYTDNHGVFNFHKVMLPGSRSQGILTLEDRKEPSPITGTPFLADNKSVCTETYIVIGSFKSKAHAENYLSYFKSRFYRFMLSLRVIAQHVNREKFRWVPDMEDYSRTYSDQDLYEHFGLTRKEIEHIEKSIKALS